MTPRHHYRNLDAARSSSGSQVPQSKYAELLAIIEETHYLPREFSSVIVTAVYIPLRLTPQRIIHARGLIRECLAETERNARL
ncbi:cyclin-dependent kinase 2-associated protein 1-like [Oncorhynchus tshawytscha]|uniref:cyclin-dependent kinase 2-associated protein 1-like n=1 Tax=Oncorhynchus tshawytscha TaxID=74940 RepID=UPI000D0A3154|nr:cyclin-dependent kinase 2-associated protein 1-like [Oncorhynchus tshawytscha]